jgi:hypothetical protein
VHLDSDCESIKKGLLIMYCGMTMKDMVTAAVSVRKVQGTDCEDGHSTNHEGGQSETNR